MNSDTRFWARIYRDEHLGKGFVPIPRKQKASKDKNFLQNNYTVEDVSPDGNLGIVPGDELVILDKDSAEAVGAAAKLAIRTPRRVSREGKRDGHLYYLLEPGETLKPFRFTDTDGKVILEIRTGASQQTLAPPSVHPSGERLYWEGISDASALPAPLRLRAGELFANARNIAAAVLVGRAWPKGSRHDAAGALAGFLAASRVQPKTIEEMIEVICKIAEDEEASDRAKFARETAAKFSPDTPTTGGPTLGELLGDAVLKKLRKWYGADRQTQPVVNEKIFDELNARWFLVDVGNDTVAGEEITQIDELSGRTWTEFAFRSFEAFRRKYVRHQTQRMKNGRVQDAPAADVWLEERCARQYDRLVYAPPGSGITLGPDDLDGWRGFTVAPKEGDWSKNKAHIRDVICAGNDVLFEWTLDWCAALFQRPGQHAETALVLRGGQGTGKGHFADVMLGRSFDGRHYRLINNLRRVFGEFNDILSGLCLLFLDEVDLTRPEWAQANKSLITGHTLDINRKFLKTATEQSMLHQICASNKAKPISVEFDDRRYVIYEVSDAYAKNITYFKALCEELTNGGRAAMLHELMHRTVNWDAQRQPPDTRAKRIAKRDSWTPVQVFLAEMLETTPATAWANAKNSEHRVAKDATVDRYLAWRAARQIRDAVPDVRRELSDAIRDHVPHGFSYNRTVKVKGEASKDFWTLPPRDQYRKSFAKARGIDESDLAIASTPDEKLLFEDLSGAERQARIEEAALNVFAVRERAAAGSVLEAWPVGQRADGLQVYAARFVDADIAAQDSGTCPRCGELLGCSACAGNGVTEGQPIAELPNDAD